MAKRFRCSDLEVADLRDVFSRAFSFGIDTAHTDTEHYYRRRDTGTLTASVNTKLGIAEKEYLNGWKLRKGIDHVRGNLERLAGGDYEVLEEALRAADNYRDDAAGIGTNAHAAIDAWLQAVLRGETPASAADFLEDRVFANPGEVAACRSFDRFYREREIIPLASEFRIWYEHGKDVFAGTVDAAFLDLSVYKDRTGSSGTLSGEVQSHEWTRQRGGTLYCYCDRECTARLILGDWKTSSSLAGHDDYGMQGEAYARSIERETGLRFDEVWIVRLGKAQAEYEIYKVVDRAQAWNEFLSLSRAYDERQKRWSAEEKKLGSLISPLITKQVIRI